jgi:outer membrane protein W
MFNVTGAAKCADLNSQTCDAKIMYWSFDFIGRYVFSNGNIRPWAGAGLGLLFPVSKSATALQASSVATTNVMMVTGGVDWFVNPNLYIPVSVEYGILPKSDEVEANWISLRIGLAVPF